MSPGSTDTRCASPAPRTWAAARSNISGATSTAVTCAAWRRAISIAVVPTPQPTSSTLVEAVMAARRSSASVDARPPGWITRLPMTAMNLCASSCSISRDASLAMPHTSGSHK